MDITIPNITCLVNGGANITFTIHITPTASRTAINWALVNVDTLASVDSGSASDRASRAFTTYNVPNGNYQITCEDGLGNYADTEQFTVSCGLVCDITPLATTLITRASGPTQANGQVTFNRPSSQQLEWKVVGPTTVPYQSTEVFTGLLPGQYTGTCRQINNPTCLTTLNFVIPNNVQASGFIVSIQALVAVTNNTLNNGAATLVIVNALADNQYNLVVTRRATGARIFEQTVTQVNSYITFNLAALNDVIYDVNVTETDVNGGRVVIARNFTIAREVRGCTNLRATNYNPVANIDDNSCNIATGNTGRLAWRDLEQYYLDDSSATGFIKANSKTDPDYIAPQINESACPI